MADLEREYSPSTRAGGSAEPHIARYRLGSQQAAAELAPLFRATAAGSLVVPGRPGAPLLVFVHGGYWQALSAAESLYLAPAAVAEGWAYAAIEYTIAPEGTLASMVADVATELAAVQALLLSAPAQVVVVGHSAGAHLVAMCTLVASPPCPVHRAVLVSGVFDLRPLVHTTVNEPLGLDEASAAADSPHLLPVVGRPEVVVAWADDDTDAFRAQSRAYAERLRSHGVRVTELECPARHHFDVIDDVVRRASALGALTLGPLDL